MSSSNKSQQKRIEADQREAMLRDAAKLEQLWRTIDNGENINDEEFLLTANRYEVPAPAIKDQSKYNPNKFVDIETFITHPYYLGLKPYPWQILLLKLFYMGSEGNFCLKLNESKKEDTKGCEQCVWHSVFKSEVRCSKYDGDGIKPIPLIDPINSRCLTCSRCPKTIRETRLKQASIEASSKELEDMIKLLLEELEPVDKFQSEYDLIDEIPDDAIKTQILNKIGNKFQELVLIIGRRGTKSFLTYVMALYESYKLLALGHPQRKLGLPDTQEIHILNVAKNQMQAKDAIFTPMKNLALASPFFQGRIGVDNTLELKLLTNFDIDENERRKTKGLNPLPGSLILSCGSSSAKGLVGKTCWAIVLDELAAMAGDNPDVALDKQLYNELKPSLTTFGKDGKIICLSNPKGPFGHLYHLYNTRLDDPMTLVVKLPTWLSNANIDKNWLEAQKKQDPVEFAMQYGAEFGSNSQDPFLSPEDVNFAFDSSVRVTRAEEREPHHEYYCHVDPSNRSDYYALAVVHAVKTGDRMPTGVFKKKIFVDHIHYWAPLQLKQPVPVDEIEQYILDLHSKFRFKQVSFDQWHSSETIERLKKFGVPAVLKTFTHEYQDKIYMTILEAFREKNIQFYKNSCGYAVNKSGLSTPLYEIREAREQFTFLQKKWKNNKYKIEALTGYHDDICDAVAAAAHECTVDAAVAYSLPKSRIAQTGGGRRW